MKRLLAAASLALLFQLTSIGQQPEHVLSGIGAPRSVLSVLEAARVSASIQYDADHYNNVECAPDILTPDFPRILELQKPYPANPVDAVRTMFSLDGRFAVSEGSNGIIRVVEPEVHTDILGVRIAHLSFDEIIDPEHALNIVLGAPEVQSFMQAHGIEVLSYMQAHGYDFAVGAAEPLGRKHVPPGPGVKSISGELNDVTLSDALDYILKTFPGFWLYQDCETRDERVVYFTLFPAPGRMWARKDEHTSVR